MQQTPFELTPQELRTIISVCYSSFFLVHTTVDEKKKARKLRDRPELDFDKRFKLVGDYAKMIVRSNKFREIVKSKINSRTQVQLNLNGVDEITDFCVVSMTNAIEVALKNSISEQSSTNSSVIISSDSAVRKTNQWLFLQQVGQLIKQHSLLDQEIEKIFSSKEVYEPIKAEWKNIEVADSFEKHEYMENKVMGTSQGYELLGARVRGKMHKNDGTNCDDWFEMADIGSWNLVAVSDGAGSKPFSRIAARESTKAIISHLVEKLTDLQLQSNNPLAETIDTEALKEDQLTLNSIITNAVYTGHNALIEYVEKNKANPEFTNRLKRPLELNDLYNTILLALQTTVRTKNDSYVIGFSFQIGDGAVISITTQDGNQTVCSLMGQGDSGAAGGETEFLVSFFAKKKLVDSIPSRIIPLAVNVKKFKGLIVMTDGVSDDYFPLKTESKKLYDDLKSIGVIERNDLSLESRSQAGKNLEKWLDEYHKKASFDDRTLVILHKEDENE